MKKIRIALIFSLAISLSLFQSCEQERLQDYPQETQNELESRNAVVVSNNVLLNQGRIIFGDEPTFEEFINYLDSVGIENFLAFVNSYNFNTFYDTTATVYVNGNDELDVPSLEAILNEHATLEIENHIIKLNFEEAEAYVISDTASITEIYQTETAEDPTSLPGAAMIVPFEENVFDIINGTSSGGSQSSVLGCDAASSADTTVISDEPCPLTGCGDGFGQVTAKYFKGGILFRLKGTYDFNSDCNSFCVQTNYTMNVNGSWNMCGPGGVGSKLVTVSGTDCRAKEVLYNKTRRLKTFSLSVDANYTCDGKNYYTGLASISD